MPKTFFILVFQFYTTQEHPGVLKSTQEYFKRITLTATASVL